MDKIATLRALLSSTEIDTIYHQCNERIAFIPIRGAAEPVAVFEQGEVVGWVRITGDSAVWRCGSMRTGFVSSPHYMGDPWSYEGRCAIAQSVNEACDELEPWLSPTVSTAGDAEHFVAAVEAGEKPAPVPAASAAAPRRTVPAVASASAPVPEKPAPLEKSPYAADFDPYLHDRARYPAAPGYSEQQLDGRVLETLHPAVVPASIGAVAMFMAILPMPYEFYLLVRWVVPAMAIWIWTVASGQKKTAWVAVFALIAVLWNPLLPIQMPRSAWVFLNVAGLVLFATAGAQLKASKPALRIDHAKSL